MQKHVYIPLENKLLKVSCEEQLVDLDNEEESDTKKTEKWIKTIQVNNPINKKIIPTWLDMQRFNKRKGFATSRVERVFAMKNGALNPIMLKKQRIISSSRRHNCSSRNRFALAQMLKPCRNIPFLLFLRRRCCRRRGRSLR